MSGNSETSETFSALQSTSEDKQPKEPIYEICNLIRKTLNENQRSQLAAILIHVAAQEEVILACTGHNFSEAKDQHERILNDSTVVHKDTRHQNEDSDTYNSLRVDHIPPEPIKDLWRIIEPIDHSDSVVHEYTKSAWYENKWKIVAASKRGKLHANEGKYREDAFAFDVIDDWHLIAVGDGAGSALLARVGANLATQSSIEILASRISRIGITKENVHEHLVDTIEEVKQRLQDEADRRQLDLRDFATTLLIMVHRSFESGNFVATVQIGDGLIIGWDALEDKPIHLAASEYGEFAGETQFVTNLSTREQFTSRTKTMELTHQNLQYIILMTDGIADDFYPLDKNLINLVRHFSDITSSEDSEKGETEIARLISYNKRSSADDRTLVVLASPFEGHQVKKCK